MQMQRGAERRPFFFIGVQEKRAKSQAHIYGWEAEEIRHYISDSRQRHNLPLEEQFKYKRPGNYIFPCFYWIIMMTQSSIDIQRGHHEFKLIEKRDQYLPERMTEPTTRNI